jgi:hypothetical protein
VHPLAAAHLHALCHPTAWPRPPTLTPTPHPTPPPTPHPHDPPTQQVIIEFDAVPSAVQARNAMHGRKFGGHVVVGTYLSEEDYAAGAY